MVCGRFIVCFVSIDGMQAACWQALHKHIVRRSRRRRVASDQSVSTVENLLLHPITPCVTKLGWESRAPPAVKGDGERQLRKRGYVFIKRRRHQAEQKNGKHPPKREARMQSVLEAKKHENPRHPALTTITAWSTISAGRLPPPSLTPPPPPPPPPPLPPPSPPAPTRPAKPEAGAATPPAWFPPNPPNSAASSTAPPALTAGGAPTPIPSAARGIPRAGAFLTLPAPTVPTGLAPTAGSASAGARATSVTGASTGGCPATAAAGATWPAAPGTASPAPG